MVGSTGEYFVFAHKDHTTQLDTRSSYMNAIKKKKKKLRQETESHARPGWPIIIKL